MKWSRSGLAIVLLLLGSCFGACAAPQRHALLIGNDSYSGNNSLRNARNDARGMADKLGKMGYITTLALDVDRIHMVNAIDTFTSSLAQGDDALVYYAGHGLQVNGENVLVPTDFQIADEADAVRGGYPLSSVLSKLMARGTRVKIIILDACRDNPYRGERSLQTGWSPMRASADTYLAFGTEPGQTASDDSHGNHGLFTQALLNNLDIPVDIDLMFRVVRLEVIRASGGAQTPWASSSLVDTFHLNPHLDLSSSPQRALLSPEHLQPPMAKASVRGMDHALREASLEANDQREDRDTLAEAAGIQLRGLHFEQAVPLLEALIEVDPHAALAIRLLGIVLHLLGRHAEAQQVLTRALKEEPEDPGTRAYWCLFSDAVPYPPKCTTVLNAHPDLAITHLALALHYVADSNVDAAVPEASAALAVDSNSAAALMLRGQLSLKAHQLSSAEDDLERANAIVLARPLTVQ